METERVYCGWVEPRADMHATAPVAGSRWNHKPSCIDSQRAWGFPGARIWLDQTVVYDER